MLDALPEELWVHLCLFLEVEDLMQLRAVSVQCFQLTTPLVFPCVSVSLPLCLFPNECCRCHL